MAEKPAQEMYHGICQHENVHQAKFCGECGARLEPVCPRCGHKYSAENKFCVECGQHLAHVPAPAQAYEDPSARKYVECVLIEKTFRIPVRRVHYTVTSSDPPHEVLQWGLTDREGSFRIRGSKGWPNRVVVRYSMPGGKQVASGLLDLRTERHEIPISLEGWMAVASALPHSPSRGKMPAVPAYRAMVDYLTKVATGRGLGIGNVTGRCLQAAHELDHLTGLMDRFLKNEPRSAVDLISFVGRQPRRTSAREMKTQTPPTGGLREAAAQVRREKAALGRGRHGGRPAFGPGMADAFFKIVDIGRSHPGLGRELLSGLFGMNREVMPIVQAFGNRSQRWPEDHTRSLDRPRSGRGFEKPSLQWPAPEDDTLPIHLTDRYNPFRRPPELPDRTWTQDEIMLAVCEAKAQEFFDSAAGGVTSPVRGGGGAVGGSLTILEIVPNHEKQQGDRSVEISVLSSREHLDPNNTGRVTVSFPIKADPGRTQVIGDVFQREEGSFGWTHRIRVSPPIGTEEGVVQIMGEPGDCSVTVRASGGGGGTGDVTWQPDPRLLACLGGGKPGHQPHGGSDLVFEDPQCEATPLNWFGSNPEIHFRWGNPVNPVYGDSRLCSGLVGTYRRRDEDSSNSPEPSEHTVHRDSSLVVWGGKKFQVELDAKLQIDLGPKDEPCVFRHESVPFVIEADQDLAFEYLTTNDPADDRTYFSLSPPLDIPLGSPEHLMRGTYYHVDWEQIPAADWHSAGIASVHGEFTPIRIENSVLGPIAQPRVQLLKATANNSFPGYGVRVLEILRTLRPAQVTGLTLTPSRAAFGLHETITIDARVAMPTHAREGISLTVDLKINTDVWESRTIPWASKESCPVRFNMSLARIAPYEGQVTISVEVRHIINGPAAPIELRARGEQTGIPASVQIRTEYVPRRKDLWDLPAEDRQTLVDLILGFINDEVVMHHGLMHRDTGTDVFHMHWQLVRDLEDYLDANGGDRFRPRPNEQSDGDWFRPLPKWETDTDIPPEFNVVKPHDREHGGFGRPPLGRLDNHVEVPPAVRFPAVCSFSSLQALADFAAPIEPDPDHDLPWRFGGWHKTVHDAVAGTLARLEIAAAAPIFYCFHARVDDIASDWGLCHPGNYP